MLIWGMMYLFFKHSLLLLFNDFIAAALEMLSDDGHGDHM